MPVHSSPERTTSTRYAHYSRELQGDGQVVHVWRSLSGHEQRHRNAIRRLSNSIRRPSSRRPNLSNPETEQPTVSHDHPDQAQFIDGQPAPSLNGQRPGFVRTFSRSNSPYPHYDVQTTPNMAYIERSASLASHDAMRGSLRVVNGRSDPGSEEELVKLERSASVRSWTAESTDTAVASWPVQAHGALPMMPSHEQPCDDPDDTSRVGTINQTSIYSEPLDQSERDEQRSIVQALHDATGPNLASGSRRLSENRYYDRGLGDVNRAGTRAQWDSPSLLSRDASVQVTITEVPEEEDEQPSGDEYAAETQAHGPVIDEGDYFGDTISVNEPMSPPIPLRSSLRSCTTPELGVANAVRLYPTNPDPSSLPSTRRVSLEDDMAMVPLPLATAQRHSPYRRFEPMQPAVAEYPRPLRQYSLHDQESSRIIPGEERDLPLPASGIQAIPKTRPFLGFIPRPHHRHEGTDPHRPLQDSIKRLRNGTLLTHWSIYVIQTLLWIALAIYYFWRVVKIGHTIPFECYELKTLLLHSSENMTLSIYNSTTGVIVLYPNITLSNSQSREKPPTPISIHVSEKSQSGLPKHCILQPVNQAVVLASSLDMLFVLALLACGVSSMLQMVALQLLRKRMEKTGLLANRTLMIRIAALFCSAGAASALVAGAAWGIRRGK